MMLKNRIKFGFVFFASLLLCNATAPVVAQKLIVFDFNGTLADTTNQRLPLVELVKPGKFVVDTIKELGGYPKKVYHFGLNSGLGFDNAEAGNPIREGFSIELYFKLEMYNAWKRVLDFKNEKSDTGPYIYLRKVAFYKYGSADMPPIQPGNYVHYVLSRDSATRMTSIYINGLMVYKFDDYLKLAMLDNHNFLNLFHDNYSIGNEASDGKIALLKIYDHVIAKEMVKENFNAILPTFKQLSNRPPAPKPKPDIIVKGNIVDKRNGAPTAANIRFERASDNSLVKSVDNNAVSGDYNLKLRAGAQYYFSASAKGFMGYTDVLDLSYADGSMPVVKNIELSRIEVGKTVTLNKIIFKQGIAEMMPQSFDELYKLVVMMKENAKMEIELSGHTDNQGNAKMNVQLSEDRVKAVKDYLISKGIDKRRIDGKGYGGTKPISSNATETSRKLNRRVEFVIKKY